MTDNWQKLKWRLQSVANNEANGGCNGTALIFVNVFLSKGVPIGWYKPQRIPLEPRTFDIGLLPISQRGDWDTLLRLFIPQEKRDESGVVDRVLVVKEGTPVGWLD